MVQKGFLDLHHLTHLRWSGHKHKLSSKPFQKHTIKGAEIWIKIQSPPILDDLDDDGNDTSADSLALDLGKNLDYRITWSI